MIFDVATGVVLVCTAVSWWAVPPVKPSHRSLFAGMVTIVAAILIARFATGAPAGLDLASATMLATVALAMGRKLLIARSWPAGAFIVAIAVVTATGTYLRAYRFEDVIESDDRQLQPDVLYYQQQALRTANPFAAGFKSPLWSAMHAPILQHVDDRDIAMRSLSWLFGILMLPAVALALGRLFEPLVGIIVAGVLAVEPWLIDLCTQGLREEFGVCLWMAVLVLLFDPRPASWPRIITAGAMGGILLLLRNIAGIPLMLLIIWAAVFHRWLIRRTVVAVLLPIMLVMPFYLNQWRMFGDPLAMEKRDARYHANLEFKREPPPGLSIPGEDELKHDLFSGEPLSPFNYLLKFHAPAQFLRYQWQGISHIVMGEPFASMFTQWLRLACAAGLIATAVLPRTRFVALFVLGSIIGIPAHLSAIAHLEQRLLLPVMVVWLAAGFWLICTVIRLGARTWISQVQIEK